MNSNIKQTMIAVMIAAALTSSVAFAADNEDKTKDIQHIHNVQDTRLHSNTVVNDTTNNNTNNTSNSTANARSNTVNNSRNVSDNSQTSSSDTSSKLSLDAAAKLRLDAAAKLRYDGSRTDSVSNTEVNKDTNVNSDVNKNTNIESNIHKEGNSHVVDVEMKKKLSLSSDVAITGNPTVSGDIQTDSAAIAVIDNRQSISGNYGENKNVTNTGSIDGNTAQAAAGNIGMNVAAGDNNTQDNAASLSAADASFAFGMADAEVFVNQNGSGNMTMNRGVTNAAGVGGNAFQNAAGNLGVNVTSGNNNEQKNALSASVATTAYAQSSISSNQVSSGNAVTNNGLVQRFDDTTEVNMSGAVQGYSIGVGAGRYEGSSQGRYSGDTSSDSTGMAYQANNFYPDNWDGDTHKGGDQVGHSDFDNETQGAFQNPNRDGVGGLAFDTESSSTGSESGRTQSRDSGRLGFVELSANDLYADLSGSVVTSRYVIHDATNTAGLSGNAFQNASGNIGVNVASGSGNLQANSLALAVAQPSTGAPAPTGGGE